MYEKAAGQSEEPAGKGTTAGVGAGVVSEVPAPPREARDLCSLRLPLHSPFPPRLVGLSASACGWDLSSLSKAPGTPSPFTVGVGRRQGLGGKPSAISPLHFLMLPTLTCTYMYLTRQSVLLKSVDLGSSQFSWECHSWGCTHHGTFSPNGFICTWVWVRDAPVITVGFPFGRGREVGQTLMSLYL